MCHATTAHYKCTHGSYTIKSTKCEARPVPPLPGGNDVSDCPFYTTEDKGMTKTLCFECSETNTLEGKLDADAVGIQEWMLREKTMDYVKREAKKARPMRVRRPRWNL